MSDQDRPASRTGNPLSRFVRNIFLPPLIPSIVFTCYTTWSGLTHQGGNEYMPILVEVWAFGLGMLGWGAVNLVCLPATMLLSRWSEGWITGIFYALAIAVAASIVVVQAEWFGDFYARDWLSPDRWPLEILQLVTVPVCATMLTAFLCFVADRPGMSFRALRPLGRAAPRNAFVALYLAWLTLGMGAAFERYVDISATALDYYWGHHPELATLVDGQPVLSNPLFTWTDLPPTAASTDNRASRFAEAAATYRLTIAWGKVAAWMLVPWLAALGMVRAGLWAPAPAGGSP